MSGVVPSQPSPVLPQSAVSQRSAVRDGEAAAGAAALVQGLLLFVPVVVLGGAIGWPGTLGDPASSMLPAIAANADAVRFGYVTYLLYSVLFGITMILLLRQVEGSLSPVARRIAVGFAIASVVARCFGITRWLAPMPVLAEQWPAADPAQQQAISTVYDVLNAWGGTIGEGLGVGLLASVSLAVLAAGLLRDRRVPRLIALGAVAAAAAAALNAAELAGIDFGPLISVLVTVIQVWFMAAGVWLLASARKRTARNRTAR